MPDIMRQSQSQVAAGYQAIRQSLNLQQDVIRNSKVLSQIKVQQDEQFRKSLDKNHPNYNPKSKQKQNIKSVPIQGEQKGLGDMKGVKQEYEKMDDHKIELKDLVSRLETDLQNGLSNQEAQDRNNRYGDNALPKKEKESILKQFLKENSNPFAIQLWVGGVLCIMTYAIAPDMGLESNLILGIILFFVNILSSVITIQQNIKSSNILDGFKSFLPEQTHVIRGGEEQQISALKLVPGDIINVKMGEKVPADIRILQSTGMKVDNSSLTGESEPLLRKEECTSLENPLETANLAFYGSFIKEGRGKGIVIRIGANTLLASIADLVFKSGGKTPLRIELDRFIYQITGIAIFLGVLFLLLAIFVVNVNWLDGMIFCIGIFVANVPEGLLSTATVALAITAQKLQKKYVLVKNLEGVETLGSTSCICTDKTGTLTQNKMTVENLWYDQKKRKAPSMQKLGKDHAYEYNVQDPTFQILHQCAIISSEAFFIIEESGQDKNKEIVWQACKTSGDATETALIKFFQPVEDIKVTRKKFNIAKMEDGVDAKMPFNSQYKFALIIIEEPSQNSHYSVLIKGAPEKILKYCTHIMDNGVPINLTENIKDEFQKVNASFGRGGERVLGFAKLNLPIDKFPQGKKFNLLNPEKFDFPLSGYTFVGLTSLIDPPKEAVPYAITKCRSAGIKVIMITGDQPATAAAIAKQVNIFPKDMQTPEELMDSQGYTFEEACNKTDCIVLHGEKITQAIEQEMEQNPEKSEEDCDKQLKAWISKPYVVFARTSPSQKLKICKACQKLGFIVAVTGDGVNDSPAIKQADIGVSMGISGSDVTKDAASMILLNDDFSSILDGVEEGRKIFDNLKKCIVYILASNVVEAVPFIAYVIFQFPLPISGIYMLFMDLGSDVLPSISIAYDDAELDVMTRRPRRRDEHLVSIKMIANAYGLIGMWETAAAFLCYFMVMHYYGFQIEGLFGMLSAKWAKRGRDYKGFKDGKKIYFWNYDYSSPNLGNPNLGPDCKDLDHKDWTSDVLIDWTNLQDANVDLRMLLVKCIDCAAGSFACHPDTNKRWVFASDNLWRDCEFKLPPTESLLDQGGAPRSGISVSPYREYGNGGDAADYQIPVCYTTEALKYAQTSYYFGCVFGQMMNLFVTKSRKISFIYTAFNIVNVYGVVLEVVICIILAYVPGVQLIFGSRPVIGLHFATPALLMVVLMLVWEETRKFLLRINMKGHIPGVYNWWEDFVFW